MVKIIFSFNLSHQNRSFDICTTCWWLYVITRDLSILAFFVCNFHHSRIQIQTLSSIVPLWPHFCIVEYSYEIDFELFCWESGVFKGLCLEKETSLSSAGWRRWRLFAALRVFVTEQNNERDKSYNHQSITFNMCRQAASWWI